MCEGGRKSVCNKRSCSNRYAVSFIKKIKTYAIDSSVS